MSVLIQDGGVLADPWTVLDDATPLPASGRVILGWDRWVQEGGPGDRDGLFIGLSLPNTQDVSASWPTLSARRLIALCFPSFADGRAYSQARLLRRHGYAGELRATGQAVVRDQLQQMKECGFDTFLLRHDQDVQHCLTSFYELTPAYQPGLAADIRQLRRNRR